MIRIAQVCAALLLTVPVQQPFRTSAEAVRVDALVLDGDQPLTGLHASDFTLRDSGVLQRIETITYDELPVSLMLAIDTSDSVSGATLEHLKRAAFGLTQMLRRGDRTALLTFAHKVNMASGWNDSKEIAQAAIALSSAGGSTALHDATYAALLMRPESDPPARHLIIIFSDGDDTASWLPGQAVLEFARRSEAVVYGVTTRPPGPRTFGYLVDYRSGLQPPPPRVHATELLTPFLSAIAAETGGTHIELEPSADIAQALARILTEFRGRYVLTYVPTGVEAEGWHPIELSLTRKRGTVTARRGYEK